MGGDLDERDSGYAATLGARLRRLRGQQQLSLQDVETGTSRSVLPAVTQ